MDQKQPQPQINSHKRKAEEDRKNVYDFEDSGDDDDKEIVADADEDLADADEETEQEVHTSAYVAEDHGEEDENGEIELSGSDDDAEDDMPSQSERRTDLVQTDSDMSDGDVPSPPPSSPTSSDESDGDEGEDDDDEGVQEMKGVEVDVVAIKPILKKKLKQPKQPKIVLPPLMEGEEEEPTEQDVTDLPCSICKDAKETKVNPILFCDGACGRLFHANCHKPVVFVRELPDNGYWYCSDCAPKVIQVYPNAHSHLLWTTPDFTIKGEDSAEKLKKFDALREQAVIGKHVRKPISELTDGMMDLTLCPVKGPDDEKGLDRHVKFRMTMEDEEKQTVKDLVQVVNGHAGTRRKTRELLSRLYSDNPSVGHARLVDDLRDIIHSTEMGPLERIAHVESIRLRFARRMFEVWSLCSSEKLTMTLSDGLFMTTRDFIDEMGPKYESFMLSTNKPAGPLLTDAFHFSNKRVFKFVEEWCEKIKCPVTDDYKFICRVIQRQHELLTDVKQQLQDDKTDQTELYDHIHKMEDYLFGKAPIEELESEKRIRKATQKVVRAIQKARKSGGDEKILRKVTAARSRLKKVEHEEKEDIDCPAKVKNAITQLRDRVNRFLTLISKKKKAPDADMSDADGNDSDLDLELDPHSELKNDILSSVDALLTTVKAAIQIHGEEEAAFGKYDDLKHQFELFQHFSTLDFDEVKTDVPILYDSKCFGVSRSEIYKQLKVPRALIEPFGKVDNDVISSKMNGQPLLRVLVCADSEESPDLCRDIVEAKERMAQAGAQYETVSGEAHQTWVTKTLSNLVRGANERIYARGAKDQKMFDSTEVILKPRQSTERLERMRDNLQNLHDFVTGVFDAIDKRLFPTMAEAQPFIDVIRNALPQLAFPDLGCLSNSKRIWKAPATLASLTRAMDNYESKQASVEALLALADMKNAGRNTAVDDNDDDDEEDEDEEYEERDLSVLFPDSFTFCNQKLQYYKQKELEAIQADARKAELVKDRFIRSENRAKRLKLAAPPPSSAMAED